MPELILRAGMKIDLPSRDEVRDIVGDQVGQAEREKARAFKHLRIPELAGVPASNALTVGISTGISVGPESGYMWSIKSLVITGLTAGSSPDVMNIFIGDRFSGSIFWQLNGNNFGVTFGKLQRCVFSGETLSMQSSGVLGATGRIVLSGEADQVPEEQVWKLA